MQVDRKETYLATRAPPALNMFHPVDFVIPTGPVFSYTTGEYPQMKQHPDYMLDHLGYPC